MCITKKQKLTEKSKPKENILMSRVFGQFLQKYLFSREKNFRYLFSENFHENICKIRANACGSFEILDFLRENVIIFGNPNFAKFRKPEISHFRKTVERNFVSTPVHLALYSHKKHEKRKHCATLSPKEDADTHVP
jgi:hypothetical protein